MAKVETQRDEREVEESEDSAPKVRFASREAVLAAAERAAERDRKLLDRLA